MIPGRRLAVPLLMLALAPAGVLAGCAAAPDSGGETAAAPPEVLIPAPDLSGVVLRTQDDEEIAFEDLRGKPTLLTFIYTRCPMPEMCPATMLRFKEVQQALTPEDRAAVRLITVSFDPFDTPAVLAEFGELWEVDTGFWTLLTGDEADVQRVAGAYGSWYETTDGQVYDHTMLTLLLLPDGSAHRILTGSAWDSAAIAEELRSLAAEDASHP